MIFKNEKREPVVIEKDGTKFFFRFNNGVRKRANINTGFSRDLDTGALLLEEFRLSLIDWENLKDEDKKDIPFSPAIRDAIVNDTDTFDLSDVTAVIMEGENGPKKPEKISTSKSA